ncbi:MAG TPA: DUF5678 domain-containing protein [Anaerolineae bacterium]|nr:DUF5678 domain-containing protein [Anaerolineae bacterium]
MARQALREVNAPYTVNSEDEAIGRDTIVIRRSGEPVAVVVPYAEYVELLARPSAQPSEPVSGDPDFERERAAFRRLLPELLKAHRGEWVAIVNEQAVEFGPDFGSVILRVRERFGQRAVYVQEILEKPRVYKFGSPHVIRS